MNNLHVLGHTQSSIGIAVVNVIFAGVLRLIPLQAAKIMFDAIKHFTVTYPNPQYLTLVKIVIFDMTIMESFRQCFLEESNTSRPIEQLMYPSSHRTNTREAITHELTCREI